jgi:hypothetical protein
MPLAVRHRHVPPMKLIVSILALVAAALLLPILFMPEPGDPGAQEARLPWMIEVQPDGNSRALGLTLNVSTLADAKAAYGPDMEVAIVSAPNELGALEAYVASARAGFVTGKLVLTARADEDLIRAMRERAAKTEYMESTTRKATLAPADLATAMALPIRAIAFIPSVNLDRAALLERFGAPAREVAPNDHQTHLLYPDKGLDIILDTQGKELLQYVAPGEFDTLAQPLTGTATAAQ